MSEQTTADRPTVGEKVQLGAEPRRRFLVRASSENFTICTRQADFKPKGELVDTDIDWRQQIRGECPINGGSGLASVS